MVSQTGTEAEKPHTEEVSKNHVTDKKVIKFLVNIIFTICLRHISMLFNFF